jgi:hypothetical protein
MGWEGKTRQSGPLSHSAHKHRRRGNRHSSRASHATIDEANSRSGCAQIGQCKRSHLPRDRVHPSAGITVHPWESTHPSSALCIHFTPTQARGIGPQDRFSIRSAVLRGQSQRRNTVRCVRSICAAGLMMPTMGPTICSCHAVQRTESTELNAIGWRHCAAELRLHTCTAATIFSMLL